MIEKFRKWYWSSLVCRNTIGPCNGRTSIFELH